MEQVTMAKLFKNGNSQAVRLPKEFRFEGDEVLIYRKGSQVILQAPKKLKKAKKKESKRKDWRKFFFETPLASPDFMEGYHRDRSPPQERDFF